MDYEPEVYNIPVNIADNGNVLNGMIKKKNLFEACAVAACGGFLWKIFFFNFSLTVKGIALMPVVLLAVVALIGVGGQSVFEIILEKYYFKKKKRQMIFKIPRPEIEKKKKFSFKKETKE